MVRGHPGTSSMKFLVLELVSICLLGSGICLELMSRDNMDRSVSNSISINSTVTPNTTFTTISTTQSSGGSSQSPRTSSSSSSSSSSQATAAARGQSTEFTSIGLLLGSFSLLLFFLHHIC
ncbi:integrator complex subunit 6 homolog [Melanotaenia boesemani]|uniref:integrator complex subunit 6 homolog n=1 Tax=Melanotaenia boesemani TaxID=1250792 RepID=UPI001C04B2DE|nr:integrator complex subunit 6 homolog [Melanotaenia boesemani]